MIGDIVFLLVYLTVVSKARKSGRKVKRKLKVLAILVLMHLGFGFLALWLDNRVVFRILTTVLFVSIALVILLIKSEENEKGQKISEKSTVTDDQETISRSVQTAEVQPVGEQGEDEPSQEESSANQLRRRGRRREG